VILNDGEIKELNARARGVNEITDVLSFPFIEIKNVKIRLKDHRRDVNPQTKCVMLGEICINLNRADEQAESCGHSRQREYAYLAVHGFLHIMGYDHETPRDKDKMREIEENILKRINLTR
jgi:probable rRNA maturation factor